MSDLADLTWEELVNVTRARLKVAKSALGTPEFSHAMTRVSAALEEEAERIKRVMEVYR